MRYFLYSSLLLAGLLGGSAGLPVRGQAPRSYFVSSACPGSAGNPSVLRRLETTGTFTTVGTVNVGGTPLTLNGLGFDSADPTSVCGMTTPTTPGSLLVPPTLYRVALASGAATAVGPVALPPASPSADSANVSVSVVLSLLGDGGPNSHYYVGGTSFTYNLGTNTVGNVRFYVGDIDLAAPVYTGPVWRLADTSDPAAAAVIQHYVAAVSEAVQAGGPVPDGGIQDWAYDPLTDHLVSYLGVEQRFLTVSNLSTAPVAVVTTPAVPIPVSTNMGYMFCDSQNNLFGMTSADGIVYALDRVTGSYLGTAQDSGLGCTLGDATVGPLQAPLAVRATAGRPTVAVFPNPGRTQLTVALSTPPPAGSRAELRDVLGRVRWQAGLTQQQTLNLTGLAPGVYVLRTDMGGTIATQRVVVE